MVEVGEGSPPVEESEYPKEVGVPSSVGDRDVDGAHLWLYVAVPVEVPDESSEGGRGEAPDPPKVSHEAPQDPSHVPPPEVSPNGPSAEGAAAREEARVGGGEAGEEPGVDPESTDEESGAEVPGDRAVVGLDV